MQIDKVMDDAFVYADKWGRGAERLKHLQFFALPLPSFRARFQLRINGERHPKRQPTGVQTVGSAFGRNIGDETRYRVDVNISI